MSGTHNDRNDEAIAQYEQFLSTAPPDAVEQINADAFEQLTTEQRDGIPSRTRSPGNPRRPRQRP